MNYQRLKKLCEENGVSGFERGVLYTIAEMIKPYADRIFFDRVGNLIAYKKGALGFCGKNILYSAHADEVGFFINHIEEDGTLTFSEVGMSTAIMPGRKVVIGKNRIPGIIGVKPIHLIPKDERNKESKLEELYIDIGTTTREASEKLGVYADFAAFDTKFEEIGSGKVKSKALDDRFGCTLLCELLERGAKYDSYFAFCVGEELGLKGSKVVAEEIKPDLVINIESTTANDIPGVVGSAKTCSLDCGVVVPFADGATIYDKKLFNTVIRLAGDAGIAVQTKTKIAGGTDAASYQRCGGGCPVIGLAIPTRYIHSAVSVASKSDMEEAEKLLFLLSDSVKEITEELSENE